MLCHIALVGGQPKLYNIIGFDDIIFLELSKYLKRKEELELMKIKKQQKEYTQSFGDAKTKFSYTERKRKLEITKNSNIQLFFLYKGNNEVYI